MCPRDHPTPSAVACGLYVHIPFCETKCGYCDFFSVAVKGRDTAPLVAGVTRELGIRLTGKGHKVRTVFCGGGTPAILPLDQLTSLLESIGRTVPIPDLTEFTVEANPATIDDDKARLLVSRGVTRVSMGAQSFLAEELATLERLHTPNDIAPSVATLRRHDVQQVNLDLMFGIPGQTLDTWSQSLQKAIDLEPDHIACYGLTYEPGTPLAALLDTGRLTRLDENLEAEMYGRTIEKLSEAGYAQYEISNFARPGCQCQHNLIYWRNGPYVGVGPSATGCVNGRRYKNVANVDGYIRMIDAQGCAEAESEIVDAGMLMTEMIMMQLRLNEGLVIAEFRERTGVDPLVDSAAVVDRLVALGLVAVSDTHLALTPKGRLMADAVITELAAACGDGQALVGESAGVTTTQHEALDTGATC